MVSPDQESAEILKVDGVNKRYGKFRALEEISFHAKRGTHTLILGPNGAGKTTLIKCVMGLVGFKGSVLVNDVDVRKNPSKAKKSLGYVPQNYAFYENLSVQDHAKFSARLKSVKADHVEEKLQLVDLWDVRKRKVKALSDGMKQRLGIALALIGDPPLLLLDEPTSNVDQKGQIEFQGLLQELLHEGKTLITTTHLSGLGDIADDVIILDHGRLVAQGSPKVLLRQIKSDDVLYLKVPYAATAAMTKFLEDGYGKNISVKGEWITVSVPSEFKLAIIKSLVESGTEIEDMLIEHTSIESEYLKLLKGDGKS